MSDPIRDQVAAIVNRWEAVCIQLEADPARWQPQVNNLATVKEAVEVFRLWLDKANTPHGFAPVYHLAEVLMAANVAAMDASLKGMEGGDYSQLRGFVAAVAQCLALTHTLVIFSEKPHEIAVQLSGELQQAVVLLGTAQDELKRKVDALEIAEKAAASAQASQVSVENTEKDIAEILNVIQERKVEAEDLAKKISEFSAGMESLKEQLKLQQDENEKLETSLRLSIHSSDELNEEAKRHSDTINQLLPGATSKGLAFAFGGRKKELNATKLIWMTSFMLSLLGLCGLSMWIIGETSNVGAEALWLSYLHRLPLVAPIVWLAWFSAIQYGNAIRVQEDYAFKEATSNAFAGYRSHMEHLAQVGEADGKSAMNALALRTIEILAREPLRIYQHQDHDVSPSSKVMGMFDRKKKEPTD